MRKLLLAGLAASALAIGVYTPAEAAQGCGWGFHRGFYGYCRPNGPGWGGPGPGWGGPGPYGYGWHRPWGYGYGWHRPWGYYHRWG